MSDEKTLEEKYRETYKLVSAQIDEKMNRARELVAESEKLSDTHGVPFYGYVSHVGQHYVPTSIEDKTGLTLAKLEDITGIDSYTLAGGWGWEHSMICS